MNEYFTTRCRGIGQLSNHYGKVSFGSVFENDKLFSSS